MLVSGERLRDEHVELLAALVGGELGRRLRAAVAHKSSIMTLSRDDRERILDSLGDAPWPLVGLRETTQKQLQRRRRSTGTARRPSRSLQGWQ
jgi:hypothetical protein